MYPLDNPPPLRPGPGTKWTLHGRRIPRYELGWEIPEIVLRENLNVAPDDLAFSDNVLSRVVRLWNEQGYGKKLGYVFTLFIFL